MGPAPLRFTHSILYIRTKSKPNGPGIRASRRSQPASFNSTGSGLSWFSIRSSKSYIEHARHVVLAVIRVNTRLAGPICRSMTRLMNVGTLEAHYSYKAKRGRVCDRRCSSHSAPSPSTSPTTSCASSATTLADSRSKSSSRSRDLSGRPARPRQRGPAALDRRRPARPSAHRPTVSSIPRRIWFKSSGFPTPRPSSDCAGASS